MPVKGKETVLLLPLERTDWLMYVGRCWAADASDQSSDALQVEIRL